MGKDKEDDAAVKLAAILLLSISAVSCSVNREDRAAKPENSDIDWKLRCADMGMRYAEQERRAERPGTEAGPVRYGFSRELQSCVYEGITSSQNGSSRYIIDLFTGEELAQHTYNLVTSSNPAAALADIKNLDRIEKRLLGEPESQRFEPAASERAPAAPR